MSSGIELLGDGGYVADIAWREVGAAGQPAFQNSWVNFDAAIWSTAAFRIDSEGWVHCKGLVKTGPEGLAIFTLPVEYRPVRTVFCISLGNNAAPAYVSVASNGQVIYESPAGDNAWANLSQVRFPSWLLQDEFRDFEALAGVEARSNLNEQPAGFIPRGTGMVQILGVAGSQGSGVSVQDMPVSLKNVFSGTRVPATDNSGNAKSLVCFPRLGVYTVELSTSFTIYGGEISTWSIEDRWIAPTLTNSWVNFPADVSARHNPAGYWKDEHGVVHLRGMVRNGSSITAAIHTLPVGFRPAKNEMFLGLTALGTGGARFDVVPAGTVHCQSNGSTAWTCMDGISFYAEG